VPVFPRATAGPDRGTATTSSKLMMRRRWAQSDDCGGRTCDSPVLTALAHPAKGIFFITQNLSIDL